MIAVASAQFFYISVKMFATQAVIGSVNPAFEHCPKRLNPVSGSLSPDIFAYAAADCFTIQSFIGSAIVIIFFYPINLLRKYLCIVSLFADCATDTKTFLVDRTLYADNRSFTCGTASGVKFFICVFVLFMRA